MENDFSKANDDVYTEIKELMEEGALDSQPEEKDAIEKYLIVDSPCETEEEKRDYLIQTIFDQMINYHTTRSELEEYITEFMTDEFNIEFSTSDQSHKEIVDTVFLLYDQLKSQNLSTLEDLRTLDQKVKDYNLQKLKNEIEAQKNFESHMKEIQPDASQEETDEQMDDEERKKLEDDGFTVVEKKGKKNRRKK
mmetsp:Transcript_3814/g.3562  ORF Transcript_3814/g.3562 Transcript_3814/m.3562 type:complete len:194 (+) Transcript_3814:143-724(+)|eukprot:CAMPEP_0197004134 /NCGR_PEP_ID=MMETSP1380-20130617/19030_1 /TAXON_ID=5936 /ORGANISM="Euplotes crassus, Strain CT5" /LENGTH=193 /DNA_ID=CAMNT_0042422823 /DNA_START=128 /DNA_END=709 /DNA_ORIENTATION=+